MLATQCVQYSWMSYNPNASYCTAACDPITDSSCSTWTQDFNRAQVLEVSQSNMQPWYVNKRTITSTYVNCHYFHIQTYATTGCMATKPYWMTFVDSSTNIDGSSALKFYLNPISP